MILFEQEHQRLVWRIESTSWNGEARLQVWPWFKPKDSDELRPCSSRYQRGFAIPLERLDELIAALQDSAESGKRGGPSSPSCTG